MDIARAREAISTGEDVYLLDASPVTLLSIKKIPRTGWQATVRNPVTETEWVIPLAELRAREEMPPEPVEPQPEPPTEEPPPEGA